ncbi:MAG: RdgB/HAM1 family non-canonical purine NTP pyrophosphatase [Legionellaceae bacterium]|nr:RdgB/HAM1 family non-canonical purine NTP pyrophosphatase [Legionellaceae bacterium]
MSILVLASDNVHKCTEIQAGLPAWECVPQSHWDLETPEETGLTFVENALLKARYASKETGLPALADDSGLVVPALAGAPGIYSARYAGEGATDQQNIAKLLTFMEEFSGEERSAYYYCVIVAVAHPEDPTPCIGSALWWGKIALKPVGTGGFGYDPVFYLPDHTCTVAELPAGEKQQLSHRARALLHFQQQWSQEQNACL